MKFLHSGRLKGATDQLLCLVLLFLRLIKDSIGSRQWKVNERQLIEVYIKLNASCERLPRVHGNHTWRGPQCSTASGKNGSTPARNMSSTACIVTTNGRLFVL